MHWNLTCTLVSIGIATVLGLAQWVTFQLGWGAGAGAAAIASVNTPPDPWWVELVRVAKRDRREAFRG
jgi:hypothetical protein